MDTQALGDSSGKPNLILLTEFDFDNHGLKQVFRKAKKYPATSNGLSEVSIIKTGSATLFSMPAEFI
jgi:hypothetical protein